MYSIYDGSSLPKQHSKRRVSSSRAEQSQLNLRLQNMEEFSQSSKTFARRDSRRSSTSSMASVTNNIRWA